MSVHSACPPSRSLEGLLGCAADLGKGTEVWATAGPRVEHLSSQSANPDVDSAPRETSEGGQLR